MVPANKRYQLLSSISTSRYYYPFICPLLSPSIFLCLGPSSQRHCFSTKKRKRHQFLVDQKNIPSFHDFQQNIQIRNLYRKFVRLDKKMASTAGGSSSNILPQIRYEFRQPLHDSFSIKRAISEGNRKYQELRGLVEVSSDNDSAKRRIFPTSKEMKWPWQKN